ncbi:uncharacterized protein SCODWIG_03183 [Saccharomycodes ludwigii]|uniref:Uncharacterized protein n=1 Tax=Saccharomycodes ludwigii TaxID=36035 RepID=A0A376B9U3_9ASCO|nr:hypothetical protein SCDLUD_001482 [Saccharomycodes ludwigii]KAH3901710.1 hypothetical protein SCDLUD_001482 [Saccharomycodes ludwigii]SSD61422.1 uncharacterized protein SCODWIG_03183 [Saccharomycodes ludwigii]
MSSDSDSDFGNFSDASFEEENDFKTENEVANQILEKDLKDGTEKKQQLTVGNQNDILERPTKVASHVNYDDLINNYLNDLLSTPNPTYKTDDPAENSTEKYTFQLDERSTIIYQQLVCLPFQVHPFNWNQSHLRILLLQILKIKDHTLNAAAAAADKNDDNLSAINKSNAACYDEQPNIVNSDKLDKLRDHTLFDKLMQKIPTTLKNADGDVNPTTISSGICQELDIPTDIFHEYIEKLVSLQIKQANLLDIKSTYEQVITNLVGHTQRIRREEIEKYNKKKNSNNSSINSRNGSGLLRRRSIKNNPGTKGNDGNTSTNTSKSKRFSWIMG